jgi:hypothetical protein
MGLTRAIHDAAGINVLEPPRGDHEARPRRAHGAKQLRGAIRQAQSLQ